MANAEIIDLADAIVTALNAGTFSESFTAERGYLPTFDLPDMDTLRVTVVPRQEEGRLDTRNSSVHEYSIDIAIQKKPTALTNTLLDALMRVVQEIADFFLFDTNPENTTLITPSIRILYLQDHLQKFRQFTSVVTLTFRGWRQPS